MTLRIAGLAFTLIAVAATAQAQPRPFKGVGQTFSDFGHNTENTLSNAGHGAKDTMSNAGHGAARGVHRTFRNDHSYRSRHYYNYRRYDDGR